MILFTFPGQGAQRPGMLHSLPDHPAVTRTLEETLDALHDDPLNLDTSKALESTIAVQLCLLVAGVAMGRFFVAHNVGPHMVAGLSIGAYPAAVIAGVLEYPDAVRLVALRGQLMESAYPCGYGMAAIVGLDRYQLEPLIAHVHTPAAPVYLANLNASRQLVIAGADEAMGLVMRLALGQGATKAERLAVGVPSHCELFDAAAVEMRTAFLEVAVRRPNLAYLSSSIARALFEPESIADDLANNMARQVHWFETARLAWERGARLALEMPSGSVLTNLTAPVFTDGQTVCCDNNRIDTLLALLSREQAQQNH
ncbi:malonate decarboxylase subunit epsilon [Undibacterium sp.]|jgi:malonate decarboxylase epsilon subunit|uniref:malonate decarboxylase subunit epsilon n=1 Tax=Undibacterium sp. TaxID=1914977 RepID=UPI002C3646E7|nr:malonate decarboxylase subunit epsilon [Undibacterium sp.]HTD04101.1 malonate decarboxylase subunit epsilon [Undibacterium sp.]